MLRFERQLWNGGIRRLAGVDEAGRGPLAGPVVAAAVIFERAFAEEQENGILNGLTDSKKLSAARRESFFLLLRDSAHVEIGVGLADNLEIDNLNILRATHVAMSRAVAALPCLPEHVIVDGLAVNGLPCPSTAIVGGDGLSLSVAAASVVAKVIRDSKMKHFDSVYPQYGFARHKGYGSSAHIQALFEYGPCPIHRRSFSPVREANEIRARAPDNSAEK